MYRQAKMWGAVGNWQLGLGEDPPPPWENSAADEKQLPPFPLLSEAELGHMDVTNRIVEPEPAGAEAREPRCFSRLEPEWAQSEWFRVWLKLARNEIKDPERN